MRGLVLVAFMVGCQAKDGKITKKKVALQSNGVTTSSWMVRSDGLKVQAYVAVPDGEGPFGVVLYNHGGFNGMGQGQLNTMHALAAEHQLILAASLYRGEGDSQGEVEYCYGEVHDVMNLLIALEEEPKADLSRVATWGFSHGACIGLAVNAEHQNLRGSVLIGTPTEVDLLMLWHRTDEEGDPEHAAIWSDYVGDKGHEMSPLYGDFQPPIFFMQGLLDDIVALEQVCMARDKVSWPLSSNRFVEGEWTSGTSDDCQGSFEGAPSAEALQRGMVLATYAGTGHRVSDEQFAQGFEQLKAWLAP